MSGIEVGDVWQGKNNEGDVLIVWANQNQVHYDYLNSLRKPLGNVYDTSVAHFLDYFEIKTETIDEFCDRKNQELKDDMSTIYDQPEPKVKADMVNQPKHYNDESGVPCCDVTDFMMFNGGNCFKYLYRCGSKFDDIEDLKKAIWYAKRSYLTGDNKQPNCLEWDNNIKEIASYREGGIYKAMTAIRSYSWLAVAAFIECEIARLEGEAADD